MNTNKKYHCYISDANGVKDYYGTHRNYDMQFQQNIFGMARQNAYALTKEEAEKICKKYKKIGCKMELMPLTPKEKRVKILEYSGKIAGHIAEILNNESKSNLKIGIDDIQENLDNWKCFLHSLLHIAPTIIINTITDKKITNMELHATSLEIQQEFYSDEMIREAQKLK